MCLPKPVGYCGMVATLAECRSRTRHRALADKGIHLIVIDIDRRRFGHGSLAILLDELGEGLPEASVGDHHRRLALLLLG